jgi:hypothetical protein
MPSLRDEIAAKKFEKPLCHAEARGSAHSFIEFRPDAHTRTGFAASQLLHYTLEPNPAATERDKDAPPERLTFGFHTADVVILGARLARLVELIGSHELAAVVAVDVRYANAEAAQPWVASIAINRLDKPGSA